jgi:PAS domain S-box-containing protein
MLISIRTKIVFITLAILFFALGANTLVSSIVFTRAYSKALESKSDTIAHSLKEKLDRLLKFNIPLQNLVGFEEQCKELVVDHHEISYAMVVDPDGKILFHNDPTRMGCFIGDFNNRKNIKTLPDECNLITQDNKEFYGISLPVFGKQGENIAIVRLGFPKELISRQTETIVLYSTCVAFIFLSLGILLSLISQNFMIIRPLDRLIFVIRNIRQKGMNSTEIVEIKSNNEIGQPGKAFNHMILEINEYQKKIKNHAQELESVVKKRTAKLREANTQLELDIVERKEIEKALRTSEEKYRLLIKNLPSIIYKGDGEWPVEFIDKKLEFVTGYKADDFNSGNLKWSDIVVEEDIEPARRTVLRALDTDRSFVREYRIRSKDGNIRWIQDRGQIVCDKKGQIEFISGVMFDVTECKQTEETLAQELFRMRILIDQSRDGIVVLDQNGKVYEANKRYAEMLGYSIDEIYQLHVWDWETQWTRSQLLEMVRTVDDTGDFLQTRHRRKDHSCYDVEISTNGAVCGGQQLVFCVCRDITERSQAAHEREKLILELQEAIRKVKQLNGLLPICSSCKRIRDDQGYWSKIETYIREHSDAEFTHGICPECEKRLYPEFCDDD